MEQLREIIYLTTKYVVEVIFVKHWWRSIPTVDDHDMLHLQDNLEIKTKMKPNRPPISDLSRI
jgi:hypothetical protein